jgi:hypothetical protein
MFFRNERAGSSLRWQELSSLQTGPWYVLSTDLFRTMEHREISAGLPDDEYGTFNNQTKVANLVSKKGGTKYQGIPL